MEELNLLPAVLGLLLAVSFGTSDFVSKGVTAKIGPYKTTAYMLLLSGVLTLLPGLVLRSSFILTAEDAELLVIVAVTTFASFAALYRAYSKGMLSLTAPIANAYPAFSVAISVAFLGASFSAGSVAAIIVIIVGIVLVSTSLSDLRKNVLSARGRLAPGVGSAFAAAVFFGASWTAFGYASQYMGYLLPAVAVRWGAAAVAFGLAPLFREEVRPRFRGSLPRLLVMVLLESAGVVIFSLGVVLSGTPDAVPILATFGGMAAAVSVTYAIIFLKERLELNHILGVLMLITGVVALLYLTG